MRLSSLAVVTTLAVVTVAGPSFMDGTGECKPETGFGTGNPSYYACTESGTPAVGDECVRWGVRVTGSGTEGRNCI